MLLRSRLLAAIQIDRDMVISLDHLWQAIHTALLTDICSSSRKFVYLIWRYKWGISPSLDLTKFLRLIAYLTSSVTRLDVVTVKLHAEAYVQIPWA